MKNAPNESLNIPKEPKIPKKIENFANQEFPKMQSQINHEAMRTQGNIYNISQQTRLKLLGGHIAKKNDNHINHQWEVATADDNFTYGLEWSIDLLYNNKPINIKANYDSYTNAPMYIRKSGRVHQEFGEWLTNGRIDRASITATTTENIFQKNNSSINMTYGGGLSYSGNLGGETLQNKWHDTVGVNYHMKAPYERWGFGAHVNLWLDAQQKLGEYIYAWAKMDWQTNIIGHGSTYLDATAYAWIKGKYTWVEGGISKRLFVNDTSPTIRAVQTGTGDVHQYIRATLGTENTKLFYETTTKDKWYGTIGIHFSRKF